MFGAGKRLKGTRLLFGVVALVVVGATFAGTLDADPDASPARHAPARLTAGSSLGAAVTGPNMRSGAPSSPCGTASAGTIAGVDASVAQGIYAAELRSHEVSADIAHVTGSQALLRALASNNEAAVGAAVHAIVYTPRWHIVRLRVERAGRVLADVGGPDIIAPMSGALRWKGRTVGTYVMSVQDDVGYVKLVSRFIGVPIDLYRNGSFLMGTLQPPPATVSTGASVSAGGKVYQARVLSARAFPTGTLRVALLVPRPTSTLASCAAVRLAAWGSIAMHIAARFNPLPAHYRDLIDVLRSMTGGLAYVRSGSTLLAGGTGPSRVPDRGTVRYDGRSWSVFSWTPSPPARIYLLIPSR
jgi:hypothetical protein